MKDSLFHNDSIRLHFKRVESHKEDKNKVRYTLAYWVKLVLLPYAGIFRNFNYLVSGSFVISLQGQGRREKQRRHAKRFMGTRILGKPNSLCGLAGPLTTGSCTALICLGGSCVLVPGLGLVA